MSSIDVGLIVGYLLGMLALGFYANRKQKNMDDYYVAGRRLGAFSIMCLWLASWIGGASVVGSANTAYNMGITAIWYVGTVAFGCILFALLFTHLVKKIGDKLKHITYPDLIEERYDVRCRVIATITTILAYIAYTAGQLAAAGSILHVLLGWELQVAFFVAAFVVIVYTATGGFLAVTYTDWVQCILLLLGVAVIGVPIAWGAVGGFAGLQAALPATHFDIGAWGWATILGLIVTITFSFFTTMDSYTRTFAARDFKAARNGTLLAALGVGVIALAATFLGMSAAVLFPEGAGSSAMATLIIEFFPIGIKGLVLVGILAAIMSTADICILVASANITRDIYHRYINPNASDKLLLKVGMISSVAIGVLGGFMALQMMDIINILYIAFTINSAGLFIPTIAALYWRKANSSAAFWSMTLSLITVLVWYLGGTYGWAPIFSVDPVWPGLIVSAIIFIPMSYFKTPTEIEIQKANNYINI